MDANTAANGAHLDGPQTMPSAATGWWEQERAKFVRSRLVALSGADETIVDVGCGRGDMLDHGSLAERTRVNVDSHIWDEWRGRDGLLFVCARADALPFRSGSFDLVGSFDVLEHIPDDHRALSEQQRVACGTGALVAAVPADQRLWSAHDEAVGHQRRYGRASFTTLAEAVGLTVHRSSYFYSFLWPPAWIARKSALRTSEPAQGNGVVSRVVKLVIGALAAAERGLMRRVSLPFGTSAWFEMEKSDDSISRVLDQ